MKIEYDEEADALYFQFLSCSAARTIDINEDIAVDLNGQGKIVGIEILNASKIINLNSFKTINLQMPAKYMPSITEQL